MFEGRVEILGRIQIMLEQELDGAFARLASLALHRGEDAGERAGDKELCRGATAAQLVIASNRAPS